jgi:hypothetical protein
MARTCRIKHFALGALMASAALFTSPAGAQPVPDVAVGPVVVYETPPPAPVIAPPAPDVAGAVLEYQAQPAPQPRPNPLRDGVTGLGATQDAVRYPRFKVEAVSFHAESESGVDTWPASDEVYAEFTSPLSSSRTSVFSNVDTGDTEQFPARQSCIWPSYDPDGRNNNAWACAPAGARGPIQFTITLLDADPEGWGFCIRVGLDVFAHTPEYPYTGGPYDPGCGNDDVIFTGDFRYEVSDILPRLDPSCRCFTETARYHEGGFGETTYDVTFRITRVDTAGEPLSADRDPPGSVVVPPPPGPIVHRSGTLSAQLMQGFEFDGGASGLDFVFSLVPFNMYRLTPSNGAKIWPGGIVARGYATCYAERASANYLTTAVSPPGVGQHACYLTSDGRVGEFQVTAFTPGVFATLTLAYTTWQ